MLDGDLVWVLLRTDYGRPSEYPVSVAEQPMAQKWVGSDVDVSRLSHKARADALSYDGVYLSDYTIGLLTNGCIVPLGPAIGDCETPPLQECQVCHESQDARVFLHTTREDIDGATRRSYSALCRSCLSSKIKTTQYTKGREAKRLRHREIIRDLLLSQGYRSNVAIAKLAQAAGCVRCGDALVRSVRLDLERDGQLTPHPMRLAVNGLVYRADYQSRIGQSR